MHCEDQLEDLLRRFRSSFELIPNVETTMWDEICRLETPFFLPDNTPINLYFEIDEYGPLITDRGETADHLFVTGVSKRKIRSDLDLLRSSTGIIDLEDEVALRLHPELQRSAIAVVVMAIQMLATASTTTQVSPRDDFEESIAGFLSLNRVEFYRDADAVGKTQEFQVDFLINIGATVQLPLWTFNPEKPGAPRRVRDLVFWTQDIKTSKTHQDRTLESPKVIVRTGTTLAATSTARKSLLALESYIPRNLIHWDARIPAHNLEEIVGMVRK